MLKNFSIFSKIKPSLTVDKYFQAFSFKSNSMNIFSKYRINMRNKRNFCEKNNANKNNSNNPNENANFFNKQNFSLKNMKKQLKEYGSLGLFVYVGLYIPTLITFYMLFKTKKLDPARIVDFLSSCGADRFTDVNKLKELSHTEGAIIAFTLICNRLSLVVRLPLTLYLTILIKKMMRK